MIFKTFTAGLLALTLGFTSMTPSTAQAQITDEQAIAGILGLFILGAAINNNRDRDHAPSVSHSNNNQRWRVLPGSCVRHFDRRNGRSETIYRTQCLRNNYSHMNRLPDQCFTRFQTDTGLQRQGWRANCLHNAGFRQGRH